MPPPIVALFPLTVEELTNTCLASMPPPRPWLSLKLKVDELRVADPLMTNPIGRTNENHVFIKIPPPDIAALFLLTVEFVRVTCPPT
jgi:hypothetical protein